MTNITDRNGEYRFLPKVIRDLHDQKELFLAIYADTDYNHLEMDSFFKIGWTQMMVNVIDVFLYNMARRGFCLKRDTRFKEIGLFEFSSIASNVNYIHPAIEKDKKEVSYIAKAREMTDHIEARTFAEVDIKVKCMAVIIDMLRNEK